MNTEEKKVYPIDKDYCPELFGESTILVGDVLEYDGSFDESPYKLIIKRDKDKITVVYRLSNRCIGLDILEQGGCLDLILTGSNINPSDKDYSTLDEQLNQVGLKCQ